MSEPTPEGGDAQIEQMLAEAVAAEPAEAEPQPEEKPDTGASKDWQAEAVKWKSLARKHETTARTNSDAAKRLSEIEDAQKSEQQKLTDRASAAEQRLASMQAQNARLMAAAVHGIPAELVELLGDGTDEQINERAELLAAKLAVAAPAPAAPALQPSRPVESLKPGAAPAAPATSPDDWIREMAGRT